MTIHKFSTPEGIELLITILEEGLVDDVWALDFTVEVKVPGYFITNFNAPPWKHLLDIRAYRNPKEAKWEYADYLHDKEDNFVIDPVDLPCFIQEAHNYLLVKGEV